MIHLKSPKTNDAFCGKSKKHDIITIERPPHRNVASLCAECKELHCANEREEARLGAKALTNRSSREKFHDWLEELDSLGKSDF